ncbi:MAG: hypothetical protein AAFR60_00145 [Pseudomonadota bacterium]
MGLVAIVTLTLWCLSATASLRAEETVGHLRLVDRLDRPVDGYCLDILGVGRRLRVDVPIFAHNCKPRLTTDSTIRLQSDGGIAFPAVGLCITAFGVNGRSLPGSPIILRPCGDRAAFFEAGPLQGFTLQQDGRVKLADTNLCLAVGTTSTTTYSAQDAWRTLSVELCNSTPSELVRWEFNAGPFPSP